MGSRATGTISRRRRSSITPEAACGSYEDEQSIRAKAKYVVDRGLGGMMFWQYTEDAEGRLLSAINKGLR